MICLSAGYDALCKLEGGKFSAMVALQNVGKRKQSGEGDEESSDEDDERLSVQR